MRVSDLKIGEILLQEGHITPDNLEFALAKQKDSPERIGQILLENEFITDKILTQALAKQFSMTYIDLATVEIPESIIKIIPENIASANNIMPVSVEGKFLTIAMSDPLDYKTINAINIYSKLKIVAVLSEDTAIKTKQRDLYNAKKAFDDAQQFISSQKSNKMTAEEIELAKADAEDQPIIRFVNNMIEEAVNEKASDIHIEPMENSMVIRFRVDGSLVKHMEVSAELLPSVTSRIKFIGGMNIAEKRIPQDGRINYRTDLFDIDMRISVLPSVFGEKIVIRITTALGLSLTMDDIGFLEENKVTFSNLLNSHRGIILLTGATGSGKSTTLYTGLKTIQRDDINIITVENPVEMIIPGITQVDINDKAGLTFASVLRSILRQDPDVIMVGEIRDKETAEIAASAAITGHVVLSTLHTYSAASSVIRLVDMGVEPYMVTSALVGVCSQKLVKRLCNNCKQGHFATEEELEYLNLPKTEKIKLYSNVGCDKCNKTGYKGRIAVHEVLPISQKIKTAIHNGASVTEIDDIAISEGMITLKENLRRLAIDGTISLATVVETSIGEN